MVPAAFPHQVLFYRKSEKLKLSEKNEYFLFWHKQELNSWPPNWQGCFRRGKSRWQKSRRTHFALGLKSKKVDTFRDIAVFSLKRGGEFRFFLPMPPRWRRRGPTPMERNPRLKEKLLCPLFHFEIFNIFGDTNLFIRARHPRLGAPYRAPGAPEGVDPHSTNYIYGTK